MTNTEKVHGHGNFQPGAIRVVDYDTTNNNILVRGTPAFGAKVLVPGAPPTTRPFVMSDLTDAITADPNFAGTGITLGKNPLIIDFCLIGFQGSTPASAEKHQHQKDMHIVESEAGWFTASSPVITGNKPPYPLFISSTISAHKGVMVYWPIFSVGGTVPTTTSETWTSSGPTAIESVESGTGNYNFAALIPAIRNALTNQATNIPGFPSIGEIKDAIIYMHCDSGVNRTGAATVGYLMTYGTDLAEMKLPRISPTSPYTLAQAQTAANSAPPSDDSKPPGGSDIPVAEAYCQLLNTKSISGNLNANCVPL